MDMETCGEKNSQEIRRNPIDIVSGIREMRDRMKKTRYYCCALLPGIISIILFCFVFSIWNWDINVPISYEGDTVSLLETLGVFIRCEPRSSVTSLGAPYISNLYHNLWDADIPLLIMWCIAKITKSVGCSVNLYYILTYGLSAICMSFVLRKLKVSVFSATIGGVIYSFIPGHFLRGESHLFIGSCFALPLSILVVIYMMRGELCKTEYLLHKRLSLYSLFSSVDKKMIFCVFTIILITFSSLYYGIFLLFLITFATLYAVIEKKHFRYLFYYILLCIIQGACIVILYFPKIVSDLFDNNFEQITVITRSMPDVEIYGLKLVQLILPIVGHRISFFSDITEKYNSSMPLVNENYMSSLGTVMSLGFLISVFSVFFAFVKKEKEIVLLGKLNLFMFCLSTVGGIASFIGMINYNIRCYNRFSFLIGIVSIIVIMKLFDLLFIRIKKAFRKKSIQEYKYKLLRVIVGVVVLCIAIWDQTSADWSFTEQNGKQASRIYYGDKEFVNAIEQYEDDTAMVLVLPFSCGNKGILGYTSDDVYAMYAERILSIHANHSKWSTGDVAGGRGDRLLDNLSKQNYSEMINYASAIGYSGMALYYTGYEEGELQILKEVLKGKLGDPVITNENGRWEYYSLSNYTQIVKNKYSSEEWSKIKELCYNNKIKAVTASLINNGQEVGKTDEMIEILPQTVQYGPYISLKEGNYKIVIRGEDLQNAEFSCTCDQGQKSIAIENVVKEANIVTYEISLTELAENVEFVCKNLEEQNINIKDIHYFDKEKASDEDLQNYFRFLEVTEMEK